jgi:CHAT domain-containing protein
VEAIAGKFKGGVVEKLLGPEVSEQRLAELLDSGKLKGYRYLHFATHGVPSRERAFDSALILSRKEEGVDGRVTAGEILRRWSLDAELVVLSACQTAVGRHAGGEGYLGFAQALLLSGAEAVVLSLWKVDDTATSLLMERFYENLLGQRPGLKAGMGKADALWEAQSWLRDLKREEAEALTRRQKSLLRDGERGTVRPLKPLDRPEAAPAAGKIPAAGDHPYADPYFWAAFILIGDPE